MHKVTFGAVNNVLKSELHYFISNCLIWVNQQNKLSRKIKDFFFITILIEYALPQF